MRVELHVLQSFPPANLNRDENGMPKSTVFGGYPRARISSQCQKRAARKFYQENSGLSVEHFAERSRAWMPELKALLIEQSIPEIPAEIATKLALEYLGAKFEAGKIESKTILFLGRTEIAAIADILVKNWPAIESELDIKNPEKSKLPAKISKTIEKALTDTGKPGDVALFGRMMASLPAVNVDAAVQMSHAISINRLQQEFDFFTAVDDLGAGDDQGADHIGETGYNSSTYYRYTNVDLGQLVKNLGSTEELENIVKAFASAFVQAIPSGHQNSFAAHSLPALVMAVVRKGQPISMVDAFETPIRSEGGMGLLDNAVKALDDHWADITAMYGAKPEYIGIVTRAKLAEKLTHLKSDKVASVDELIAAAIKKAMEE